MTDNPWGWQGFKNVEQAARFGAAALQRAANEEIVRRLMRHRERYVKAWLAATGVRPDDAVLVTQIRSDGTLAVWMEKKGESK